MVPFTNLSYHHAGHEEHGIACLPDAPRARVLLVLPLFDEMNRLRRTAAMAMRILGDRSIATLIPDLPGTHESEAALDTQSLDSWAMAVAAAADQWHASHIASFRGGALIDHGPAALPHWRCAPARGANLLKTMLRTRIAADKEAGVATSSSDLLEQAAIGPVELAGNLFGPAMIASLSEAQAADLPDLTALALASGNSTPAPGEITGSPLWLRAEPGEDPAFAKAIADGITAWVTA